MLCKPPTGEETKPTSATRDDVDATKAHRSRHNAHHDLACVEPTLQCAERQLVLRLHVEALQREARQHIATRTRCEQYEYATHPRGAECHVSVERDCTVRGRR